MSLLPENYDSANFEKENDSSQFFELKNDEDKNTIRILGDAERPETFIMGYQAWGTVNGERKKKTTPPTEKGYAEMLEYCADDDNEKVKKVWLTQIYNHTLKCAQVWEIPQKRIRQDLEKLLSNPKWGDLRNYDITVTRNGKAGDSKTTYSLIADPPIEPPSDEILFAMEEARIDCRAVFGGGYPMGSLDVPTTKVIDDQSNIERLKSKISSMEKDDGTTIQEKYT
jgi:hypothetical protein